MPAFKINRCWAARAISAIGVCGFVALPIAACSSNNSEADAGPLQAIYGTGAPGTSGAAYSWLPTTIRDLLPNQPYSYNGAAPKPLGPGIVVGKPRKVVLEASYATDDFHIPGPLTYKVPSDSPNVEDRSYLVTMSVEESMGAVSSSARRSLTFHLGASARTPIDEIKNGIMAADRLIVILEYERDGSKEYIPFYDLGLGTVSDDGKLDFPGMESVVPGFLGDVKTLTDLYAAANEPTKIVKTLS